MKKVKEDEKSEIGNYRVLPFVLLLVYMLIDRLFDIAFPYSISILSIMILISIFIIYKYRKGNGGMLFETIMLIIFALMTITVLVYFIVFP